MTTEQIKKALIYIVIIIPTSLVYYNVYTSETSKPLEIKTPVSIFTEKQQKNHDDCIKMFSGLFEGSLNQMINQNSTSVEFKNEIEKYCTIIAFSTN